MINELFRKMTVAQIFSALSGAVSGCWSGGSYWNSYDHEESEGCKLCQLVRAEQFDPYYIRLDCMSRVTRYYVLYS